MRYIVSNTIRIVDPTERMKDYVEEKLVIKNPQFEQLQRLGKWTGNTPHFLVRYYDLGQCLRHLRRCKIIICESKSGRKV